MCHTTADLNSNRVGFTEATIAATVLYSLGTLYAELCGGISL
jgi:hypothetical protein